MMISLTALALAMAPAQDAPVPAPTLPATIAVSDEDQAAIAQRIRDIYAVISGPAGQERDWDKMRAMMEPGAKLSAITPKGVLNMTLDEYIEKSGPILVGNGFSESELVQRMEAYGRIAHVWSSYDGATETGGIKVRGINSFQLAKGTDGQWRVQSIFWQQEIPQFPLPKDMEK